MQSLRGDDGFVTMEELQERKVPPGMDRFIFSVALAEKWTK